MENKAVAKNTYSGLKSTLDITLTVSMWLGAAGLASHITPNSKGLIFEDKRTESQILFFTGAGLTIVSAATKAMLK